MLKSQLSSPAPPAPTVLDLQEMLHAQAAELAGLRAALDVQMTRIAQMQAELDLIPHKRPERETLRKLIAQEPVSNGNGRTHR